MAVVMSILVVVHTRVLLARRAGPGQEQVAMAHLVFVRVRPPAVVMGECGHTNQTSSRALGFRWPVRQGIGTVSGTEATRIRVTGGVSERSRRDELREHALELGLHGWVRLEEAGTLCLHAEGDPASVRDLVTWLPSMDGFASLAESPARVEGHEQFMVRGVPAGVFVVQEHQATAHHFDLRLEVDGVMRSWAVPKGPSMDPAVKRLAVQVDDHALSHNDFEGSTGSGAVIVWDRGSYEQGGRVPWPEALERGHAVFVLHGEKLQGGFALQRTRPGEKPQWLLLKRRDELALPGSDIVAEQPRSVRSGSRLDELLGR
jgi:DNA ligase D-like protein (predicted 3'-phosphoesterase)